MLKLGKPTIRTFRGTYILRSEKLPSIGAKLYDKNKKPVAIVKDIFGPVSLPYIEVKPLTKKELNFVLYLKEK